MIPWTEEENATLRHVFKHCPWPEIMTALPNRTRSAISTKANEMGIGRGEEFKNAERAASGLKGSRASVLRRQIAMTLRHPIEAAWRGM